MKKVTGGRGPVDRPLTKQEARIAQAITDGLSNRQIASQLKVKVKTVEVHRANLYRKLRVRNTAQLIAVAVREGLVKFRPERVA